MKKAVISAVAVVVFSGVAMCQTPAPAAQAATPVPAAVTTKKAVVATHAKAEVKAAVKKVNGTVSSYDAVTGALDLKAGKKEISFTIAKDVKIVDKAGKPAIADEIKAGSKVALTTTIAADKTVTVSEVKILKAAK